MSNAMYYIVFIAGFASTSSQASAELERASVASGMMRRELKQEVEVTAHAFAQSAVPKGKAELVRKTKGDTSSHEKATTNQDRKDTGKTASHHKSHHHHHHGHGHHHQDSKHEPAAKVTELDDAGPQNAGKEKLQKKDAKHAKDEKHGKEQKHLEKKSTDEHGHAEKHLSKKAAAHNDAALDHIAKESDHALDNIAKKEAGALNKGMQHEKKQDEKNVHDEKHLAKQTTTQGDAKNSAKELQKEKAQTLAKNENHADNEKQHDKKQGHDSKHSAQKAGTHSDAKHIAKELPKEKAHTLAKDTKHADDEKQHDKKQGHDDKHSAQKAGTHSDTEHIAKELPKEKAHTLAKDTKHADNEKQHDKKAATHGNSKNSVKDMKETTNKLGNDGKRAEDEKHAKSEKRASSLNAAEDAGHIRDLGDAKTDEASTLEEIAKEVESLHLTESELDPDENYHAHKHEAFQVKVTGPEGSELCLSEVHHGYQVRAVKCSRAHGQHWYWEKQQLKTLKSKERCLGFMSVNGHREHQLAMYPCVDDGSEPSHTGWKMDASGRLRSLSTDRCMAFDETAEKKMNAITLLCDEA